MDIDRVRDVGFEDAAHSAQEPNKRERSKIEFPYSDLEGAMELSRMLLSKTGGAQCEDTQLASWMNQTATGGTFRTRVYAARMFGLIEMGQNQISLTRLGRDALDEAHSAAALVDAFLRVPLFSKLYESYKGYSLPPAAAIERQIESLGVSSKQKDRARQTFMKSAATAGFIDAQTGRFTKPPVAAALPSLDPKPDNRAGGSDDGDGGGSDLNLDPLLIELLKKIPPAGDEWPAAQRVRWFRTFAMNVSQIYDDDSSPIDLKITLENTQA